MISTHINVEAPIATPEGSNLAPQAAQNSPYQWVIPSQRQSPPFARDLPQGEGFSPLKIAVFNLTAILAAGGLLIAQGLHAIAFTYQKIVQGQFKLQGVADLGLSEIYADLNQWQTWQAFEEFFRPWTLLKRPIVADRWRQDAEFGRQRLVGMNPAFLRQCLPADIGVDSLFKVTDRQLQPSLGAQFTLAQALQENRLFILDYGILQDITQKELQDQLGRYPHAPFCLLYLNDEGELMPIAIQLDRHPHPHANHLYTPNASAEWLMAKTLVASADAAYQGIVSHLVLTHLVMEVMIVATHRTLPQSHILMQLLSPHFFNTLAINKMARTAFLGRGAFFDTTGALGFTGSSELISRAYAGHGQDVKYEGKPVEFYQLALPYSIALRGVADVPNYYYRDDAQLIWDAIYRYVQTVLQGHYSDSAALAADQALQNWKTELIAPDRGGILGLLPPEQSDQLTGPLTDIEALTFIVTTLIFTATAQHSAVNFGQYDYAAWVPNMAFALYQKLADLPQDGHGQLEGLLPALPDRLQTLKQVVLVKTLVTPPPFTSASLKSFSCPFSDPQARSAFRAFKQDLNQIESTIQQRNAALQQAGKQPYVYLLPSRIAQSVAI